MSLWRLHGSAPLDCVVLAVRVLLGTCPEPSRAPIHMGFWPPVLEPALLAMSTAQDPTDCSLPRILLALPLSGPRPQSSSLQPPTCHKGASVLTSASPQLLCGWGGEPTLLSSLPISSANRLIWPSSPSSFGSPVAEKERKRS